jgi:hypothetical protein
MPKNVIDGPYPKHTYSFVTLPYSFFSEWPYYSLQLSMNHLVFPHPTHHVVLVIILQFVLRLDVHFYISVVLILISLMVNNFKLSESHFYRHFSETSVKSV